MDHWKVDVPEGESGGWQVKRFTVTPEMAKKDAMRAAIGSFSSGGRCVPAGTDTRLGRGEYGVTMSDTPSERRDHMLAIHEAKGRVLLVGLGLGCVLQAILEKLKPLLDSDGRPVWKDHRRVYTDEFAVDHVTVIEQSADVIALVGPHYEARYGDRITIIEADINAWKPPKGERWDTVWIDIWDDICADNWPEMKKLHARFCRRARWCSSWCKYETQKQAAESRAEEREESYWTSRRAPRYASPPKGFV